MDISGIKNSLIDIRERMFSYVKLENTLSDTDMNMYYEFFKNDSKYLTEINKIFNIKEMDTVNDCVKSYIINIKRKLILKKL